MLIEITPAHEPILNLNWTDVRRSLFVQVT